MPPSPDPPFDPQLPPITIRPGPLPLAEGAPPPGGGEPGPEEGAGIEEVYLRRRLLESLGADSTALKALRWDSTSKKTLPDGGQQTIGHDDLTGMRIVIETKDEKEVIAETAASHQDGGS